MEMLRQSRQVQETWSANALETVTNWHDSKPRKCKLMKSDEMSPITQSMCSQCIKTGSRKRQTIAEA